VGLGYGIERSRQGWELKGIPRVSSTRFSRRSAQMSGWHRRRNHRPKEKDALGRQAGGEAARADLPDLLAAWGVRLTADEKS